MVWEKMIHFQNKSDLKKLNLFKVYKRTFFILSLMIQYISILQKIHIFCEKFSCWSFFFWYKQMFYFPAILLVVFWFNVVKDFFLSFESTLTNIEPEYFNCNRFYVSRHTYNQS